MMANRFAYGKALYELAKENPKIVVVDSDLGKGLGYTSFRDEFPDRFFDCGIAEQNMCSIAAGLSTCGLIPFAGSFAVFTSMRALDQIRNASALYDLNAKFIGTHGGIETAEDGATHQAIEDVAIMRSLPNMKILAPCCPVQTAALTKLMVETPGTFYMRFGRAENVEHYSPDDTFTLGGSKTLREGNDVALLAYGRMVDVSLEAADLLKEKGINARVIDVYSLKPIDEETILRAARETRGIVTAEDHSIIGGLGGAVSELLCEKHPTKVRRVGMQDCYGRSGKIPDLFKLYGLTKEKICEAAMSL